MQEPPQDEQPTRTVPETTEQKSNNDISDRNPEAFPVAAKWNVDIISKKMAERNMPASPEIADAYGSVGFIEILRQMDVEQQCYSNRHIGIAAEIIVDL